MNGYQFIASLVQSLVSLAWPVAFVIAVMLFRVKLSQLLPFLRLKHKETEVSFRLDQAEYEVKQIPPPALSSIELEPTPEEVSRFERVAEHSPRAAILEKRAELNQALLAAAEPYYRQAGVGAREKLTTRSAIRVLRKEKLVDDRVSALLDDLRVIGNQAAHEPDLPEVNSKKAALRFGILADTAIRLISP